MYFSVVTAEEHESADRLRELQRGTTVEAALAFYDSLGPVGLDEMRGLWRGADLPTGNPFDGLLENFGWYGKRFEDLTVRNMVGNRSLARAISDAAWSDLRAMLEYKAGWYGRALVVVDRWFPSSKLCSACGRLAKSMPLYVRSWTCPGCGAAHDRDVNAARNVLAAGLAES